MNWGLPGVSFSSPASEMRNSKGAFADLPNSHCVVWDRGGETPDFTGFSNRQALNWTIRRWLYCRPVYGSTLAALDRTIWLHSVTPPSLLPPLVTGRRDTPEPKGEEITGICS